MNRDAAITRFRSLGAACLSHRYDGRDVMGIQLRHSAVTDHDLAFLEFLSDSVEVIGLEGTDISDAGLQHLLKLTHLDNVDLTDVNITDRGLEVLSRIPTLQYIHIEGTQVTHTGVEKLQADLPACEIMSDFD